MGANRYAGSARGKSSASQFGVRIRAASGFESLAQSDPSSLEKLVRLLKNADTDGRKAAARALRFYEAKAVPALVLELHDPDSLIVSEVTSAL
jgi:4'-phosphopantetheinyl transferase EntD